MKMSEIPGDFNIFENSKCEKENAYQTTLHTPKHLFFMFLLRLAQDSDFSKGF